MASPPRGSCHEVTDEVEGHSLYGVERIKQPHKLSLRIEFPLAQEKAFFNILYKQE